MPAAVTAVALAAAAVPSPAAAESCQNATYRTGASGSLPDCRAYELVTPGADKHGNAIALTHGVFVSHDGSRASFTLANSLPDGAAGFGQYVASRGPDGWTSRAVSNVTAPDPVSFSASNFVTEITGTSADMSQVFVYSSAVASSFPALGAWRVLLDGTTTNLAYSPIGGDTRPAGSSTDGSHVVLGVEGGSLGPLPGSPTLDPGAKLLYEAVGGQNRLIDVDNSGNLISTAGAVFPGNSNSAAFHAISADGSRIFFLSQEPGTAFPAPLQLYVRIDGQRTIEVSASRHSAPQPAAAEVNFGGASADGTKVFFTTAGQLTDDATGSGPFLYEFDLPSGDTGAGTLKLAAGAQHPLSEDTTTHISQVIVSDDGSHVYYLSPDDGGSLFVYHASGSRAGQTVEIKEGLGDVGLNKDTRLAGELDGSWMLIPAEVSPDGNHLIFTSNRALVPGDSNTGAQIYKFDDSAEGGSLTLVSTGPAAPDVMFHSIVVEGNVRPDAYYGPDGLLGNNVEPTFITNDFGMGFATWYHAMSDDGRYVFFETGAPLVAQDVNGKTDVYEWHDGKISLISPGNGSFNSYFIGASADGSSAIFATRNDLVSQDGDGQVDFYAARIDGGFPPLPQPASCDGDACQGQSSPPPAAPNVGTVIFDGLGNLAATAKASPRKASVSARKTVKGSSFTIGVKVPAKGRISASGSGLRSVSRAVSRAATYHVKVVLTARAKRSLKRHQTLKVRVRVRYAPANGTSSTTTVSVTLKA